MIRPKRAPYSDTKVDPDRTKAEISKMLRDYGCDAIQWTEDFNTNLLELRFIVEVEVNGTRQKMGIKLVPPLFMQKRKTYDKIKGQYVTEEFPNFSQSMRLMLGYLKPKLAAVAWGLRPFEEEFLSEIIVPDEQGRERRLVDVLKEKTPRLLGLPDRTAE